MRRHHWLIPLAAALALVPMLVVGPSNGKDYVFHLSSWLGAADQMRHGMLWPRWDFLAAYNAGEPRFVFYPPISWMIGALLSFVFPVSVLPFAMVWICLLIAGFAMYGLARRYCSSSGSLVATCVYMANPWMWFTILARCAYGELFAAAFCPWLLANAMEQKPKPWRIALPLGLIWLSNIPGAILCTYLLGFVLTYRLITEKRLALVRAFVVGLLLALALDAMSFLPALVQRKYIDTDGAFPEGFRPIDNLSFFRTLPSDPFFVQTQHLALLLLVATLVLLLARKTALRPLLLAIAVGVALSLTWLAKPFWAHLPALWVVQFPWRALFVLATVGALAAGLALERVRFGAVVALLLAVGLSAVETRMFLIPCTAVFQPRALQQQMVVARRNGVPTYEYYVLSGDSNFIRPDNPPYWVASDPAEYAIGTTANLSAVSDDATMPVAPATAKLVETPMHFRVTSAAPAYLAINLQDYPNWLVTLNGSAARRLARTDGLTAVAIPAGESNVDIRWRHSWDEVLGVMISLGAFAVLGRLCLSRESQR